MVHVLDPDHPGAAVGAGIQPAGQGGDERARMQQAGGRGGEAADVGRGAGA
ncbi:MAG: hypothetical protein ACOVK6_13975 [Ramlibacter sp.]